MASETVNPIAWPIPPQFTGQYTVSATGTMQMRATNQCAIGREPNPVTTAQDRGNRLAYNVTQWGH